MSTYSEKFNKAEEFYDNGYFEKALSLFEELWKETSDGDAALLYANCLNSLGKYDEAKKVYTCIIEIDPEWEAPLYNLAGIYYNREEYEKAIDLYTKAAEVDTDNGDAYFKLGECYRRLNDINKAITYYKKATEAAENNLYLFDSFYYLGVAYLQQDNFDSAFENLAEANNLIPEDSETLFFLGLCSEKMNNTGKAIAFYDEALKIKPDCNTHINIGLCYYDTGELDSAVLHLKSAFELEPDNPDALFYYCYMLTKSKQGDEAYHLLKSTEINFDNDERTLDILIFLALNRRQFDVSDAAYEKLKLISPECETVAEYTAKKEQIQKK